MFGPRSRSKALIPTWSIYFGVYNQLKETFEERHSIPKTLVHLYSAAVAAAITDVATNPLWVIKTRLQARTTRARALASLVSPRTD